jgi:hypothetical protein
MVLSAGSLKVGGQTGAGAGLFELEKSLVRKDMAGREAREKNETIEVE